MAETGPDGQRRLLRTTSAVALLVCLLATVAGAWVIHLVLRDQERRLLKERTDELELVFTGALDGVPAALRAQGRVLEATDRSTDAYEQAARRDLADGQGALTFAWLRPSSDGSYVVLAAAGDGLQAGDAVTGVRARAFDQAMRAKEMVATPVMGDRRLLGFALGKTAAPAGTVLYQESVLGPLRPPQAAGTAPFSELDVAIYAAPRVQQSQVLVSTTSELPIEGARNRRIAAGAGEWLLSVRARSPLVGNVAAAAPWAALVAGLVGSLLIAVVIETAARRRDGALALYATEHRVAETLQRSLLPQLPTLPGLDLAARYLASGVGQEVGGDWFDVFPLSGDRVGLAVGDVIGHDVEAASAMAQIRASLRAFALHGASPAAVITQLDQLVDRFRLTQLVTVVYGELDPPDGDGNRVLRYSNAGHLPPLLRQPDGRVDVLSGGGSVVIGAPIPSRHTQAETTMRPGSTLVLFTDGLVEVPGRSLDEAQQQLADIVATLPDPDADAVCDRVLSVMSDRTLRDDIALLAVRLTTTPALVADGSPSAAARGITDGD